MHLLTLLQQPRPVLLLHLLLPQHELHIPARVIRLGILHVDLPEEFQFHVVRDFFRVAVAGEGQGRGGEVDFRGLGGHIGGGDGEVDVVAGGVRGGGALGPGHWMNYQVLA